MLADPRLPHQIQFTCSNKTGGLIAVTCNCLPKPKVIKMARELPAYWAREHYRHWHAMRGIWVP
jgi:hypothetical protein